MLLGARFLASVSSANSFNYLLDAPPQWTVGETVDVYFQLVDATQDLASQGYKPAGRRYCPASGATLTATLTNIDDAKALTRSCSQPFPTVDPSIWKLSVVAADSIVGSTTFLLTLNEGGRLTYGRTACGPRIRAQGAL